MFLPGTPVYVVLMLLLVGLSLYAAVGLVRDNSRVLGIAARLWVMVTAGVVGLDGLVFGGNALLSASYQAGVSLVVAQVVFVGGTLGALLVWDRR
jgi:hypothetical protein